MLKKPNVLVDTSFLLPALGFEIEPEAMGIIRFFRKVNIYYIEAGLMEAVWKILRHVKNNRELMIAKLGIESIRNTYTLVNPPSEAYIEAIKIYNQGHKDLIDSLHYATAKTLGLIWLTIDYDFIKFLRRHNYPVDGIIIDHREFRKLVTGT